MREALLATGNPNLLPSLLVIGAGTAPAAFVAFIRSRRLDFTIPFDLVAGVGLVGGVVGVVTSGVLEYDTLRELGPVAVLGVGVIEESTKLVAPAVILAIVTARRRRTTPADGLLLGVASGAGFAALETMGYAFVTVVNSGSNNLSTVDDLLLLRGLLSPAAHMAWTGLTAAALWRAALHQWRPASVMVLTGVLLGAIVLHAAWDCVDTLLLHVVLVVVGLVLLTWTAHRLSHPGPPLSVPVSRDLPATTSPGTSARGKQG